VPEEIVTFQDIIGTRYHKVKVEVSGYYDSKGHWKPVHETKSFPVKHYHGPFPIFLTLLTSMFMHGDLFHLIGNMWFLLVFGRNVECAMSHGRFLAFYVACGICASLAHVFSDMHSILPCLGASGAISGIMGAYVSIHPLNRIKIWFGWWLGVLEVPAIIVIGFWFLLQYLSVVWSMEEGMSDGIAYWAHLGGFCAGFAILRGVVFYLRRQQAAGNTADEPLAPIDKDVLSPVTAENVANPFDGNNSNPNAPDPFATFLSVQAIRKIQQEKAEPQTSE
jgi:membrane associated rhomboid family serine protease